MDNLLQMLQYTSFLKFCEVSKLRKYQDIYCKMDPWKFQVEQCVNGSQNFGIKTKIKTGISKVMGIWNTCMSDKTNKI